MNKEKGTKTRNNLGAWKIKDREVLHKFDIAETQKELREVLHNIGTLEFAYRITEEQKSKLEELWTKKAILKAKLDAIK